MRRLLLIPTQEGHALRPGSGAAAVNYGGGATAYRSDVIGAPQLVSVTWTLESQQFDYIMAFYRLGTMFGSLPFLMFLPTGRATFDEVKARIVPGTWTLSSKRGDAYTVEAQLEVETRRADLVADAALVAGYAP